MSKRTQEWHSSEGMKNTLLMARTNKKQRKIKMALEAHLSSLGASGYGYMGVPYLKEMAQHLSSTTGSP